MNSKFEVDVDEHDDILIIDDEENWPDDLEGADDDQNEEVQELETSSMHRGKLLDWGAETEGAWDCGESSDSWGMLTDKEGAEENEGHDSWSMPKDKKEAGKSKSFSSRKKKKVTKKIDSSSNSDFSATKQERGIIVEPKVGQIRSKNVARKSTCFIKVK